jgi:hypothetical protein
MIFLGSVAEAAISDRAATYLPQLVQRPPVLQAIEGATRQEAVRRLVVGWVVECPNRSEVVLQQRLKLALVHELREAVPLALGVAQNDPAFLTVQPATRAVALMVVGQFGSRGDADKLEPLLEDATVCLSLGAAQPAGQAAGNVQIRDVALVVMLQLTDQNPADYGYSHTRRQSQRLYDLRSLYADSDEQRTAAAAKWRAWKAKEGESSRAETREPDAEKQGS